MHPLAKLAKQTVEQYIMTGKVLCTPTELDELMKQKAGVFVCIKKHGELRGCIGTFEPATDCVASEIITNAISTSTEDPRFMPVDADELKDLQYTVDVLTTPRKINDRSELDPKKYGVIVACGRRKGLLLPDLQGVDTVDEQLKIAMLKAGIDPSEKNIEIYRFEVNRYN